MPRTYCPGDLTLFSFNPFISNQAEEVRGKLCITGLKLEMEKKVQARQKASSLSIIPPVCHRRLQAKGDLAPGKWDPIEINFDIQNFLGLSAQEWIAISTPHNTV